MQEVDKFFGDRKVRAIWDENGEEWYFSIVDIVSVLTGSVNPLAYWRKLKQRLKAEGNQTVTNCHALKMTAADGKMRMTDVARWRDMVRRREAGEAWRGTPALKSSARLVAELYRR